MLKRENPENPIGTKMISSMITRRYRPRRGSIRQQLKDTARKTRQVGSEKKGMQSSVLDQFSDRSKGRPKRRLGGRSFCRTDIVRDLAAILRIRGVDVSSSRGAGLHSTGAQKRTLDAGSMKEMSTGQNQNVFAFLKIV